MFKKFSVIVLFFTNFIISNDESQKIVNFNEQIFIDKDVNQDSDTIKNQNKNVFKFVFLSIIYTVL